MKKAEAFDSYFSCWSNALNDPGQGTTDTDPLPPSRTCQVGGKGK